MKVDRWTLTNDGHCEKCAKPVKMVTDPQGDLVLFADVQRLQAYTIDQYPGICKWHYHDADAEYVTDCGKIHMFEYDPVSQGFQFCPYCGGSVEL